VNRQLLLALALFAIMAGGVAWIAFVLVKAMPILLRVYGAASVMKRRTDLLKQADVGRLTEHDLDDLRQLTVELQGLVRGALATRLVERELESLAISKLAAARGDWDKVKTYLAEVRRTWP
jgi:predicted short-subunit dehydrogenase-like oxidoreductase (DUF2520 family)